MKRLVCLIVFALALMVFCSCGDGSSFETYTNSYSKYDDLNNNIKNEINKVVPDGLKFTSIMDSNGKTDVYICLKEPIEYKTFYKTACTVLDVIKPKLNENKIDAYKVSVVLTKNDSLIMSLDTEDFERCSVLDGTKTKYYSNILIKHLDKGLFQSEKMGEYVSKNNVSLNSVDVQYDMPNNLNKMFTLSGTASLSDYYNYGFRDVESNYFCIEVIPDGGTYSDVWYVYCERSSFKDIFIDLKSGNEKIECVCEIPSKYYKKGQGNMAIAKFICW